MAFVQVVNKTGHPIPFGKPYVRVNSSQLVFNKEAVEAAGKDTRAAVVLFDKVKWVIGFCFLKNPAKMRGSYLFSPETDPERETRHITVRQFLENSGILKRVEEIDRQDFPLEYLGTEVPEFEGERIWGIRVVGE